MTYISHRPATNRTPINSTNNNEIPRVYFVLFIWEPVNTGQFHENRSNSVNATNFRN